VNTRRAVTTVIIARRKSTKVHAVVGSAIAGRRAVRVGTVSVRVRAKLRVSTTAIESHENNLTRVLRSVIW
jgi:hypothetical protein